MNLVDPDGELPDFFWDVFNVGVGLYSLGKNIIQGKFGDACIDAGGVVVDGFAAVIPFVPGGVGTSLKLARAADDVVDAGKFIDKSGVPQNITKNLRNNLKKATGLDPKDMEAHHMLPQKFKDKFGKAKININDPKYGIWLEKKSHSKKSYEYNQKWEDFFEGFEKNNSKPTTEEIETYMKQVMKETFDIDL